MNANHFYVYLVSSDFTSSKLNTPSHFINTLQTPRNLPVSENWQVALHGLYASNITKSRDEHLVQIDCSIILPKYDTGRTIGICTRPKQNSKEGRLICHEPVKKEFFPLRNQVITEIEIKLCNRKNIALDFVLVQPTLVILEFKKMSKDEKEYIIRVDSKQDCLLYTSPSPRDKRQSRMPSSA